MVSSLQLQVVVVGVKKSLGMVMVMVNQVFQVYKALRMMEILMGPLERVVLMVVMVVVAQVLVGIVMEMELEQVPDGLVVTLGLTVVLVVVALVPLQMVVVVALVFLAVHLIHKKQEEEVAVPTMTAPTRAIPAA
jgi:hypothetical protein